MYLHIGKGSSVDTKDIIGIFDLDTATVSSITKNFINKAQREGRVEYKDSDLPRSFIVVSKEKKKSRVRLSRISVSGLKLRAGSSYDFTIADDN